MGLSIKTRGGGQGGLLMQRQGLETHIHVVNKHSYESRESEKHNVYLLMLINEALLGHWVDIGFNATVLFHQNFICF